MIGVGLWACFEQADHRGDGFLLEQQQKGLPGHSRR